MSEFRVPTLPEPIPGKPWTYSTLAEYSAATKGITMSEAIKVKAACVGIITECTPHDNMQAYAILKVYAGSNCATVELPVPVVPGDLTGLVIGKGYSITIKEEEE